MIGIRCLSGAVALALLAGLTSCPAAAADDVAARVSAAVADGGRLPYDVVRDADRKPEQTVAFSMIKPGEIAVDLVPGDGYYARILSKLVRPTGKLYMLVPLQAGAPGQARRSQEIRKSRGEDATLAVDAALAIQNVSDYNNAITLWETLPVYGAQFSVPEQVDAVWIDDNYHNLHNSSFVGPDLAYTPTDPATANAMLDVTGFDKAIFQSMNPGGYFTVIDYAANKGAGFTQTETLQRVDPDAVKQEVISAGFVLDGESSVLANANDDHSKPAAALGDKADQFMLRFRKPMDASNETKRPPANAMDGYYGNTAVSGMGTPGQRWVSYHPDGTYQEFGISGAAVQLGTWYWDAAGHNCMIHQYPPAERQGIVCHTTKTNVEAGDSWTQDNGNGGERPYELVKGYVQPDPSQFTAGVTSR